MKSILASLLLIFDSGGFDGYTKICTYLYRKLSMHIEHKFKTESVLFLTLRTNGFFDSLNQQANNLDK